MQSNEILAEAYRRVNATVHQAAAELDGAGLAFQPEPGANSIAWLVWHLSRIQDDHISEIAGARQAWADPSWARRTGIYRDAMTKGQGDRPAEVAAVRPPGPDGLLAYHDTVMERTFSYLAGAADNDLDRIIDTSYTPPVSVGVRIVSVLNDNIQHAGQALYLRGILDRMRIAGQPPSGAVAGLRAN